MIGTAVMKQIKDRVEHSKGNEKSEIQGIHFVKGSCCYDRRNILTGKIEMNLLMIQL